MQIRAECYLGLYADPWFMLHFSWYCSCLVPLHPLRFSMLYTTSSIMLSNRLFYSIFYSSLDHTSLFRLRHPMLKVLLHCGLLIYAFLLYSLLIHALLLHASLSHALLLTLCCYISRCFILCCSTIATPLFPVPCTRLHACVLCSNLHWSIVYRPILRWFVPSFSVLCCPMRCGFMFDWPILAAWLIRFFVPLCCFTAPGFMFLHAVCGSMLYTDPRLILLPPWICCCIPRSFMAAWFVAWCLASPCFTASLPRALCCSMLYADTCFMLIRCLMQIHALCRSMLYTAPCCTQIYALSWSMLDFSPSAVMLS